MDNIEKYRVFALNEVAISSHSTVFLWKPIWPKNTKMLNGEDMFLFTTLLKLFGAINGYYEKSRVFFNKVATFRQITVFL